MSIGRPISLTPNIASKSVSATATADQTSFTVTGGYRINELGVYRNGVRLVQGKDFTASDGSTVTLLSGATVDDIIDFVIFDSFNIADAINTVGNQTINGELTATKFIGNGSELTGVGTDNINTNNIQVSGISTFGSGASTFSGEVTAAGGGDVTGGVKAAGIVTFTNTTASTSSATGALVVSGGVGIAGSLHVGENVSVGGTLTYEDVTNIDVIGIITARAGILVNGGRGIDIAGGGLEVAGVTTLGTNVKIGSAVTFNNNSGINVTGIVTATGLNAAISVWTLGADGTNHYTFSGPGFTGTPGDPIIYLQRGQKYVFQNRSGGHPFRIQSTVNGSSGTAYSDGVTNNDAANGTDLVWNVQQDAPDVLYYQCTSHANMGGVIYIGNRFQSLQEPYDFWMFGG